MLELNWWSFEIALLSPWWLLLWPVVLVWWWRGVFQPVKLPNLAIRHAFFDAWLAQRQPVESHPYTQSQSLPVRRGRVAWGLTAMLLVLAMAQPVWFSPQQTEKVVLNQASGQLVLETSVSLLLREADGQTRLQQAQAFVHRLVAMREGQSVLGLSIFADEVYPVLSPTQDMAVITSMVDRLDAAFAGRQDSAILEAIQFAAWQLQSTSATPAWLLLMTDGAHASSRGELQSLMDWLAQTDIQLHVLLLGGDAAVAQPAGGLLYMPRQLDLLAHLAEWGVTVTPIEDEVAVEQLLHQLTQTAQAAQHSNNAQTQKAHSLTTILVLLALCVWLLVAWRAAQGGRNA